MTALAEMQRRAAQAKQERADMRRLIRGIGREHLTKAEKLILERVVSLWFTHRYGEGMIRPGRERLAKLCQVHTDTVRVALGKFRALGIMQAVAYAQGGTKATRYTVNLDVIRGRFGAPLPVVAPGELTLLNERKSAGSKVQNPPVSPAENPPRIFLTEPSEGMRRRKKTQPIDENWDAVTTHRGRGNA